MVRWLERVTLLRHVRHDICLICAILLFLNLTIKRTSRRSIEDEYPKKGLSTEVVTNTSSFTLIEKFSLNNTIILTICNAGMAKEWLQQWYVSARRLGIENLFVIATDKEAFWWIRGRIGKQVILVDDLVPLLTSNRWVTEKVQNGTQNFAHNWRSKGYEQIVTQRATILKEVMSKTKLNILYSDTDIHWLNDPRSFIEMEYQNTNFCVQREKGDELGDYNCSGFLFLRYSALVLTFLETWEKYIIKRLHRPGFFTDQSELNELLTDLQTHSLDLANYDEQLYQIKGRTFDWDNFPSGINYFSQRKEGRGRRTKICRSKVCRKYVWKSITPANRKKRNLQIGKNIYIVHHNFAKSNPLKIKRAKDYGLWLNLFSEDWDEHYFTRPSIQQGKDNDDR